MPDAKVWTNVRGNCEPGNGSLLGGESLWRETVGTLGCGGKKEDGVPLLGDLESCLGQVPGLWVTGHIEHRHRNPSEPQMACKNINV